MPTFEIGLDDGRKLRIDADDQQTALDGAQHFLQTEGSQKAASGLASPFKPIPERPVLPPSSGTPGNWSSDITQRARNTALGTGPGSVEGIPGLAVGGVGGLAGIGADAVGAGAARAFSALPEHIQTAIISAATMAGAAGAKDMGLPEWLVHWAENRGLIRGFGKHNP